MNIKNERGVTLLMLIVTIIVMLIIATVLIRFSVGDKAIIENAENAKIEEEIRTIKSRVESEVKAKQAVKGTTQGITLTAEEQKEILGKYYTEEKLVVDKNGKLCRHNDDNWKDKEQLLIKLRNRSNKWSRLCRRNRKEKINYETLWNKNQRVFLCNI